MLLLIIVGVKDHSKMLTNVISFLSTGISAALSQIGWWGGIILLGEIGPILISSPLQTSGTLYFLSGMCLVAFLHVLFFIPETKVTIVV